MGPTEDDGMRRLSPGRARAYLRPGALKASLVSRNEHKLEELRPVLGGWEVELLDADDFPPEDGATYYDNAYAKARFGRTIGAADVWMLGEDSGIEVTALGGRPGPLSARYAAPGEDIVDKLLAALGPVEGDEHRARYVCELVCVSPDEREFRGTGVLDGRIAAERRGSEGFGYDPIFVPEGETQTVAELGNAWKAQNSHRARAARGLREAIGEAAE